MMKTQLNALSLLEVLRERRDAEYRIKTISTSEAAVALGMNSTSGVAVGQAASVIDYVCVFGGQPLVDLLIDRATPVPWDGVWEPWNEFRPILSYAARHCRWNDKQLDRLADAIRAM